MSSRKMKIAILLIVNAIYLAVIVIWFCIEGNFEPIVAFIGGILSLIDCGVGIKSISKSVKQGDNSQNVQLGNSNTIEAPFVVGNNNKVNEK